MANASVHSIVGGLARGASLAGSIWRHPGNRSRRARGVAGFLAWQFVKHVLKPPVVIRFHNQRLKCYPESTSTSGALYFSRYRCAVFDPQSCRLEYTDEPWMIGVQNVLAISCGQRVFVEQRLRQSHAG